MRGRLSLAGATVLLLTLAFLTLLLALRLGSVPLTQGEFMAALLGRGNPTHRFILLELRLPRALLALLIGGGLALAGGVFQALLRNPLAEPYILGISGGAATGAVFVLAGGFLAAESWALPLASFVGATLAVLFVFGVARSADQGLDVRVLLLSGVVVGAFFSACIALILSVSDAPTVRSSLLWMMGGLSGATWRSVAIVAAYTLPLSLLLLGLARPLNLLSIDEETAGHLGTDVELVKRVAYGAASGLAAAGVAFAGIIGFVGLVVPHTVRLLVGGDHRALLPLSLLSGGVFLLLADLAARLLIPPGELPVGVITAFVGVPFFLILLRRSFRK